MNNFDVREYLNKKGIEFEEMPSGKWIRMKCILPDHDDKNPSFFIHTEHLGYNCYVCGHGSWTDLCRIMQWEDWDDGNYLVDITPTQIWKDTLYKLKEQKNKNISFKPPRMFNLIEGNKFYNYMFNRGIESLIKRFNVKCSYGEDEVYKWAYNDRILIPVHDVSGRYVWMEGRLINDANKKYKYYRPPNVNTSKYLFNYHRAFKKGFDRVIVVEGIIDAMILWANGYSAVCCFGAKLSNDQLSMLVVFSEIVLCFDNDKAGIKATVGDKKKKNGAIYMLKDTGCDLSRIIMPKGKDVNDISIKKFNTLYLNRKAITY